MGGEGDQERERERAKSENMNIFLPIFFASHVSTSSTHAGRHVDGKDGNSFQPLSFSLPPFTLYTTVAKFDVREKEKEKVSETCSKLKVERDFEF
jgi:hypothetical protein